MNVRTNALEALEERILLSVLYPDLLSASAPADHPALPGEMDVFAPPVDALPPSPAAPAFAEWTRSAGPDDVLTVTGDLFSSLAFDNLGRDTRFTVFGQTSPTDATLAPADILRLDASRGAVVLDDALPAHSAYLVWCANDAGYGRPAIVNATDAWWVGPKVASRGDTVSAYGRNLSHDNGTTTAWVYLQPAGGPGRWVTPSAVNPYKVDFPVPADLANGSYEVWVHNGHGGAYGWSQAGSLTVDDGMPWTATVFNVRDYGAVGDGVTDDRPAIVAAYTAARNAGDWNTVYFPAGTYAVGTSISIQTKQRWVGDGMNATSIVSHANWGTTGSYALLGGGGSHNEVVGLTLQANAGYTYPFLVHRRGLTNTRYTGVRFRAQGRDVVDAHSSTRLFFTGCELIGKQTFLGTASQVFIDGTDYYATNDAGVMWYTWGGDDISVTNSTGQDYDNSDPNSSAGWGQGRWFTGNGIWGSGVNTYIGDNATHDLAVRPLCGEQNTGEQLMWEGNNVRFRASPTAATDTTVTLPGAWNLAGAWLTITDGKGVGQVREITAYDAVTKALTVRTPFNVVPDATSVCTIGNVTANLVIYNNHFDGKSTYATQNTASTAIEPFGGCHNVVAAANTLTEVRTGISLWGLANGDPAGFQACYWNLYTDNTITNTRTAINTTTSTIDDEGPGSAHLGNTFRNTVITGTSQNAVRHAASRPPEAAASLTVFEDLTITDSGYAIVCSGPVADAVFYSNDVSLGGATYWGSRAIEFTSGQVPVLRDNTWTGYETTYAGPSPGAILELPTRVLTADVESGSSVVLGLPVWNVGPVGLSWSATDNADWIALAPTGGSVPDEQSAGSVTLTCTAKSYLEPGVHEGVVTITGAGWVQRATVLLTVSGTSGSPPPPATVTLTASDPAAAEAPTDTGTFTFTRSNAAGELRVRYTVGGSAGGDDYDETLSGYVVFAPGQDTLTLTLTPNDDDLIERDETVILTLAPDEDYTIAGPATGTVTIVSDDRPAVSITATDHRASESGSDTGTFTLTRSGAGLLTQDDLVVYYTVSGTAEQADYVEVLPGVATIPAGQASTTITITPIDDTLWNEGAETVILTLLTDPAYTLGASASDLVAIAENDWTAGFFDITSGFYANRSPVNGVTTQIGADNWWYHKAGWTTGNKGNSFSTNPSRFVLLTDGRSGTSGAYGWWVPPNRPYLYNGKVDATGHAGIQSGTSMGTGVYVDAANGTMLALEWKAPIACIVDASYTFIGRNHSSSDLEFHLGFSSGTNWVKLGSPSWVLVTEDNVVGSERTLSASGIRLNAGESIILCVNCYDLDDYDGALITGGITFNPLPEVTIAATDPEAFEQGQETATYTVTRVGPTTGDLTVYFGVDASSTASAGDYTLSHTASVVIPDGQASAVITLTPIDDALIETPETLTLVLLPHTAYALGTPLAATAVIFDNDTIPGDVNGDGLVDAADIDDVFAHFTDAGTAPHDLNADGRVDDDDVAVLVRDILGTQYGDATLDGTVDLDDLTVLGTFYGSSGQGWAQGDFNGDGRVDLDDLTLLGTFYGFVSASAPEATLLAVASYETAAPDASEPTAAAEPTAPPLRSTPLHAYSPARRAGSDGAADEEQAESTASLRETPLELPYPLLPPARPGNADQEPTDSVRSLQSADRTARDVRFAREAAVPRLDLLDLLAPEVLPGVL